MKSFLIHLAVVCSVLLIVFVLLPKTSLWRIQLCAVVFCLCQDPAVYPQGAAGELCSFPSSPLSQQLAIHGYEIFRAWDNIFVFNKCKEQKSRISYPQVLLCLSFTQLATAWDVSLSSFFSFQPCHSDSWFLDPSLTFCNSSAFSILSQMKSL